LINLLIIVYKYIQTKDKVTIDEPAVTDGDKRFFTVSDEDDGPGIPQEEITQIFKKFIKVSSGNGQYDNLGGTGIGLALAKSLTEKHGGQLKVSSIPHEKTVFQVLIPYAGSERSADVQTTIPVEPHAMRQGAVILVVEDDMGK